MESAEDENNSSFCIAVYGTLVNIVQIAGVELLRSAFVERQKHLSMSVRNRPACVNISSGRVCRKASANVEGISSEVPSRNRPRAPHFLISCTLASNWTLVSLFSSTGLPRWITVSISVPPHTSNMRSGTCAGFHVRSAARPSTRSCSSPTDRLRARAAVLSMGPGCQRGPCMLPEP